MKYKILFFLFFLFLLLYLYIAHLNQDMVRLYVGYERYYENSAADFVFLAFVVGVIFAFILGFFFDLKRLVGGWREERRGKKREEFTDAFEKAKAYDRKGDREKTIEAMERLARRFPANEEPYLFLADLHTAAKDYDRGMDVLRLAEMNLGRKEGVLLRRARILVAKREGGQAKPVLEEILAMNEASLDALMMLRDHEAERKNWDAAIDLQKRLCKYVKTDEEQGRLLGIRYEKAKEAFRKGNSAVYPALMKDVKDLIGDDKRFIPAYILLADIYRRMDKPNETGRVYGRGYTRTGHIIFLIKMEDLYIARGDPGVILKIYQRIIDISPKNHLILFLYARLCLRLEMIDEATDMLNTLLAEGEDFPGLHRAMAEACVHRGETRRAIEEFQKAFPMERAYIPFICDRCGAPYEEWSEFCANCSSWNSIIVKKEDFLPAEVTEIRDIYAREAFGESAESMEGEERLWKS